MKRLAAFLIIFLSITICSAQELNLNSIKAKSAPRAAKIYLKAIGVKVRKAKWFYSQSEIYVADLKKRKKQNKVSYYFKSNGEFILARREIIPDELSKEVKELIGDRAMSNSGVKLFSYQSTEFRFFGIQLPPESGKPTLYYTEGGEPYLFKLK